MDMEYLLQHLRAANRSPQLHPGTALYLKYGSDFLDKLETVKDLARQSTEELFTVYSTALAAREKIGHMAIVGVYRGGDALLTARTKRPDCELHLFDMFEEGMPASPSSHDAGWPAGSHKSSLQELRGLLKEYPNLTIHPGFFPGTALSVKDKRFSWVHVDADLYQTTQDALLFFAPRMIAGGIILCHDYWSIPAVKIACDEFISSVEGFDLIPLAGSHCGLVRIASPSPFPLPPSPSSLLP